MNETSHGMASLAGWVGKAEPAQPPGSASSFFYSGKVGGPDSDTWASTATRNDGSWWPH